MATHNGHPGPLPGLLLLTLASISPLCADHAPAIDALLARGQTLKSSQVRKERDAVPVFEEALRLSRLDGDRPREARALTGLGSALASTHRSTEALKTLAEALPLAHAIDAYDLQLQIRAHLATVHIELGHYEESLALFAAIVALARKRGDPAGVATGYNGLAAVYRRQGDFPRAAEMAARTIDLLDHDPKARSLQRLLFSAPYLLGRARLEMGDYSAALPFLHRGLAAAERAGNIAGIWHSLNDMALWYQVQGDWTRATSHYRRALEVARKPHSRDLEGLTLRGMAEVARVTGRFTEARDLYEESLRLFTVNGIEGEVPVTLIGLAGTRVDLGEYATARSLIESAVKAGMRRQQPLSIALGRFELGRLALRENRLDEADEEYRAALALTSRLGFVALVPHALAGLGDVARARRDLPRAIEWYKESANAIDALRSRIPALEQRAAFAAHMHETYESLLDAHLEVWRRTRSAADAEAAFAVLERERTPVRSFGPERSQAADAPVRRQLDEAAARIQLQLASPEVPRDRRALLRDDLEDIERKLTDYERKLTDYESRDVVTQNDGRQGFAYALLDPHEAFVALAVTRSGGTAFVATHDHGLRIAALPPLTRLNERIEFFARLLAAGGGEDCLRAGSRLSRELVAPWLPLLPAGVTRVTVASSGVVASLPFGALPDPGTSQPLVRRFAVAHAPSLAAMMTMREAHSGRTLSGNVLAFGFGSLQPRRVAVGHETVELPALRSVDRELRSIRRAVGRGITTIATGGEASLKRLSHERLDLLHIAAHAFLDPYIPARSAIVVGDPADAEDGLLLTREISRLRLRGATVILSSCQTASGPVSPAEGMVSLAGAFGAAGAASVVGTYWRVGDEDAARLVDRLYEHLARGRSVAEGLRAAQLDLMAREPYANASHWSAFAVLGDGASAPLPARHGSEWLSIGLLSSIAVIALAVFAARWLRR